MAGPELQEDLATDLDAEGQVSSRPVFKDGHRFQPPKFVGTNTWGFKMMPHLKYEYLTLFNHQCCLVFPRISKSIFKKKFHHRTSIQFHGYPLFSQYNLHWVPENPAAMLIRAQLDPNGVLRLPACCIVAALVTSWGGIADGVDSDLYMYMYMYMYMYISYILYYIIHIICYILYIIYYISYGIYYISYMIYEIL